MGHPKKTFFWLQIRHWRTRPKGVSPSGSPWASGVSSPYCSQDLSLTGVRVGGQGIASQVVQSLLVSFQVFLHTLSVSDVGILHPLGCLLCAGPAREYMTFL